MGRVEGKVVIVTGAARGMGVAHARRLLEEGAKVVLTDVLDEQGSQAARDLGANALFIQHDVSKEAEWQRVVADTERAFGPVSVLINNAGISGAFGPLDEVTEADYRRVIDINQLGVFLGMKSVLPSMKRAGGGSIINISSAAGLVGVPYSHAYVASKFAVRGMTKSAALDLAAFNIRVNSVHPGVVRTPLVAASLDAKEQFDAVIAATPVGRVAEPEDLTGIVLLLASDESRFATGAEFVIDGGFTCH